MNRRVRVRVWILESTVWTFCLPRDLVAGGADRKSGRAGTVGQQKYPIGGRTDRKSLSADPTSGPSYRTRGQPDAIDWQNYRMGGQNYAKVAGIIAWWCSKRP